jgi:hypothetical protein
LDDVSLLRESDAASRMARARETAGELGEDGQVGVKRDDAYGRGADFSTKPPAGLLTGPIGLSVVAMPSEDDYRLARNATRYLTTDHVRPTQPRPIARCCSPARAATACATGCPR